MIKRWKVTAEINMDASHYESCIVKANTARKAAILACKAFKKKGYFYITNLSIKEID